MPPDPEDEPAILTAAQWDLLMEQVAHLEELAPDLDPESDGQ